MRDPFLIRRSLVTEKASRLNALGKYVFMVKLSATKMEVKKAVKDLYGVDATAVNIVRRAAKPKRFKNRIIRRGEYKKAFVTLKTGQKIDLGA